MSSCRLFFHFEKLLMLTNEIMLAISRPDTLRPWHIYFRPFANSARDTKYHKRWSLVRPSWDNHKSLRSLFLPGPPPSMIDEYIWTCFAIDPYTLQDRFITYTTQIITLTFKRRRKWLQPNKTWITYVIEYMSDSTLKKEKYSKYYTYGT